MIQVQVSLGCDACGRACEPDECLCAGCKARTSAKAEKLVPCDACDAGHAGPCNWCRGTGALAESAARGLRFVLAHDRARRAE